VNDDKKDKMNVIAPSNRFVALDFARGLAAFSILIFHHYQFKQFSSLYSSVDFFFVLSGFVLLPSIERVVNYREAAIFIRNRAVRLLPMSMSTIVFVVISQRVIDLKHLIFSQKNSEGLPTDAQTLAFALLLLQVFSYSAQWLNGPLWSLSVEWISNLIFASFTITQKFRYILIVILSLMLQIHSILGGDPWELQLGRGLLAFTVGVVTRKYLFSTWVSKRSNLVLSIVLFFSLQILLVTWSPNFIVVAPFVFAFMILNTSNLDISSKRFQRLSEFLGRYSYGFYAWHYPFLMLTPSLVSGILIQVSPLQGWSTHLVFFTTIIMSLFMTHIVMRFIEPKARQLFLPNR
jgi:peptidoglycan/LPS O-acetylase OafA/YrhL